MSSQYNSDLVSEMARLGKPFCTEDNARLYPLVAAGDAAARREMIEGNMSLVVARVDMFLAALPHLAYLRDDLTSAGFLALTRAVATMQRRTVKSPTSYLSVKINGSLRDLIEGEPKIRARRQSRWIAKTRGKEIKVPRVTNAMPDCCRLPLAPQVDKAESRDLLRSCCKSNLERRILRLRESGFTYEQVAANVPRSKSEIDRILDRLEADYCRKRGLKQRPQKKKKRSKKSA